MNKNSNAFMGFYHWLMVVFAVMFLIVAGFIIVKGTKCAGGQCIGIELENSVDAGGSHE